MTRSICIAAAPHAAFRKLSGDHGAVLLHLKSAAYFRLNELGATVWRLVQDETPFDELVIRVRALYDDPPPELEDDVARFVDELTTRDLVTIRALS
ncbi:MAG: PqqD family protein [Longimicrobiales bacterium]